MDLKNLDRDALEYFNSLAPMLQESVMQSSAPLSTRRQLESYCRNVTESTKDNSRKD